MLAILPAGKCSTKELADCKTEKRTKGSPCITANPSYLCDSGQFSNPDGTAMSADACKTKFGEGTLHYDWCVNCRKCACCKQGPEQQPL
jgi:hypothetical protein